MRKILLIGAIMVLTLACSSTDKKTTETESETNQITNNSSNNIWDNKYDKIEASELPDNIIDLISEQWMLVTAGSPESFNTMTASWGGIGYVWNNPVSFIFIRDSRYTYQFLEKEESYTLSFFDEKYRGALRICGTKSGRDSDKIIESGLTPIKTPNNLMSFDEARMIIECKKMFVQELNYDNLTPAFKNEIMTESYTAETSKHQLFISQIINIWIKK